MLRLLSLLFAEKNVGGGREGELVVLHVNVFINKCIRKSFSNLLNFFTSICKGLGLKFLSKLKPSQVAKPTLRRGHSFKTHSNSNRESLLMFLDKGDGGSKAVAEERRVEAGGGVGRPRRRVE